MTITSREHALLDLALSHAKALGADAAEASVGSRESLSVDVRLGALESVEREESAGLTVRVLLGKRQSGASMSSLSPDAARTMIERIVAAARLAPEDPYAGLLDPAYLAPAERPDLDLFDPATPSPAQMEAMAAEAEAAALAVPGVTNSTGAGVSWGASGFAYANSHGFRGERRATRSSIGVSVLAERDGAKERDGEGRSERWAADLPSPAAIGRIAGERTARRLGARKLDSRRAPIIFENCDAGSLLGPLFGAISGPSVARGVSFLRDRLGEAVFPAGFEILNDPLLRRGSASRTFDGEGMAVQARLLIEDGRLTGWLHNSASARQLGMPPTGDASFGGGGAPGAGACNVAVKPGVRDLAGLMADAGEGLLVCETFSPSLNRNSGDYSVGVAGFWFEAGGIAFPVSEVTIAGNLKDWYARLLAGADVEQRGALSSPSLLVDDVAIAGR
jgi:PmbA protein